MSNVNNAGMQTAPPVRDTKTDSTTSIAENRVKYAKYFEEKSGDTMDMDTFYKLLMAEMSNQDPLEPMSNTEFISQMASFTSLKSQSDSLYYSNANYASSMVGKTVIVASPIGNGLKTDIGVVSSVVMDGKEFKIVVNDQKYALNKVMEIVSEGGSTGSIANDGAFANGLIGKTVTVQTKDSSGSAVIDEGVVTSLEIKDGVISIIINKLAYSLSDVVRVQNATENTDEDEDDEIPETKPDTKPDETPETKPEETPETKPEGTPETKPEGTPETKLATTEEDDIPDLTDEELAELFS